MLAGLMSLASMDILNGKRDHADHGDRFAGVLVQSGGEWDGGRLRRHGRPNAPYAVLGGLPESGPDQLYPSCLPVLGDANQYQPHLRQSECQRGKDRGHCYDLRGLRDRVADYRLRLDRGQHDAGPRKRRAILIYAAKHYLALPASIALHATLLWPFIFSTANSFLHVSASTAITDVYLAYINPKAGQSFRLLFLSRLMVVVFGLIAFFVTLMFAETTGFFRKALYAFTIYGSSITPTLVAAIV